jgi:hypothetical protein
LAAADARARHRFPGRLAQTSAESMRLPHALCAAFLLAAAAAPPPSGLFCANGDDRTGILAVRPAGNGDLRFALSVWFPSGHNIAVTGDARPTSQDWRYEAGMRSPDAADHCRAAHRRRHVISVWQAPSRQIRIDRRRLQWSIDTRIVSSQPLMDTIADAGTEGRGTGRGSRWSTTDPRLAHGRSSGVNAT